MTQFAWTDDRVETLKTLWAEGESAAAIAKALGGTTRNAVIGKIHRIYGYQRRSDEQAVMPRRARVSKYTRLAAR